jgi:hypothetical protein
MPRLGQRLEARDECDDIRLDNDDNGEREAGKGE